MNIENYSDKIIDLVLLHGPKIIGAVIIWFLGGVIIKGIMKGFDKILSKKHIDESLVPFLKGIVGALLKVRA